MPIKASGIYIHIPFCKQACHYCNFHFSTSLKYKEDMINAILQEIDLRKDYLNYKQLDSIYFGGGTPSLLNAKEILRIINQIQKHFSFSEHIEITIEANPDDLSKQYISTLKKESPINRFSVGVQSFFEADLKYMHRAHNADEAYQSLQLLKDSGFDNITIDLIYGTPTMTDEQWQSNIEKAVALDIPHLSCYNLTVEPQTPLEALIQKGKKQAVDDHKSARQFEQLIQATSNAGFEHYEISNFAKKGHRAVHNSNYWLGGHYLGIGPSAHSYNQISRQWNIAHNAKYMKAMAAKVPTFEIETLDSTTQYNEYLLTRLRTVWGVQQKDIEQFGAKFWAFFKEKSLPFLADERLLKQGNIYVLSFKGKFYADAIAMDLFYDLD